MDAENTENVEAPMGIYVCIYIYIYVQTISNPSFLPH